ncbi:uncharacterized protein LOC121511698 isoform X3 [Cheilinus undulatus]|uniref:uncharacterized protein LOC121511698 isoform X3 n=1 Tax=Cheilinus undulatus TaxID=241271 RepID=UPI001BD5B6C0|nr:uncharacterized protein LOC121511698 isoform X3 [Cheilinus undulatus]XP_041646417.1 uncharacterized protein LOC121511698 isoform X3 [Cheilinus undulatus]XP_041646422.1 uncharacterized protein LOC121511698 isoform X3 [Cheilinus undulatus]
MILSRSTSSSSSKISADTSSSSPPPSSSARPHLGTSSLVKFKRHQDLHLSFRRTWGKYHTTRKLLILSEAAAAAAEATVNMSLKADAEPNNNVSIEEEVRTLFVSGLPVDIKPRELYLLFRPFKGYEGSLIKLTSKQDEHQSWEGASIACGRTIHSHSSQASPPYAGHTLLWDGIPFFSQYLSQVSRCDCVGHSGTPKLILQVFNGVKVRTAGRPFHPLHSQTLEVVSDKPRSVGQSGL